MAIQLVLAQFARSAAAEKNRLFFFEELKHHNVVPVGLAHAVVAWLLLQLADVVLNNIT